MGPVIPAFPESLRASALLNGSDSDFIINAYLALQRQWPDAAGFAHYLHVLSKKAATRAEVLRRIAESENARRCKVEFVDDLPADHMFRPEDDDSNRLNEMTLRLRLGRAVADLVDMRRALSRLTTTELSGAVEAIALAQQAQQATLESRLARLEANANLMEPSPSAAPSDAPAPEWEAMDATRWRYLAAQQMQLRSQLLQTQQAMTALAEELAEVRQGFTQLHIEDAVQVKRDLSGRRPSSGSVSET